VSSLSNRRATSAPPGITSRSDIEASVCGGIASAGVGTTSASEDVCTSPTDPDPDVEELFDCEGSGRDSRFDRLQRGQTQSLDLEELYKDMSDGEENGVRIRTTLRDACARMSEPQVHQRPRRLDLSMGKSLGVQL
jgi:hypothetical protein